jgi:hypothetical protein
MSANISVGLTTLTVVYSAEHGKEDKARADTSAHLCSVLCGTQTNEKRIFGVEFGPY